VGGLNQASGSNVNARDSSPSRTESGETSDRSTATAKRTTAVEEISVPALELDTLIDSDDSNKGDRGSSGSQHVGE